MPPPAPPAVHLLLPPGLPQLSAQVGGRAVPRFPTAQYAGLQVGCGVCVCVWGGGGGGGGGGGRRRRQNERSWLGLGGNVHASQLAASAPPVQLLRCVQCRTALEPAGAARVRLPERRHDARGARQWWVGASKGAGVAGGAACLFNRRPCTLPAPPPASRLHQALPSCPPTCTLCPLPRPHPLDPHLTTPHLTPLRPLQMCSSPCTPPL